MAARISALLFALLACAHREGVRSECDASIDPGAQPHGSISLHNYPDNARCTWFIRALPSERVRLLLTYLDVEEEQGCAYDRLTLKPGGQPERVFCGRTQLGLGIPRAGAEGTLLEGRGQTLVAFQSDESTGYGGFTVKFSVDVDWCRRHEPCAHGATCSAVPEGYRCSCSRGWSGRRCEQEEGPGDAERDRAVEAASAHPTAATTPATPDGIAGDSGDGGGGGGGGAASAVAGPQGRNSAAEGWQQRPRDAARANASGEGPLRREPLGARWRAGGRAEAAASSTERPPPPCGAGRCGGVDAEHDGSTARPERLERSLPTQGSMIISSSTRSRSNIITSSSSSSGPIGSNVMIDPTSRISANWLRSLLTPVVGDVASPGTSLAGTRPTPSPPPPPQRDSTPHYGLGPGTVRTPETPDQTREPRRTSDSGTERGAGDVTGVGWTPWGTKEDAHAGSSRIEGGSAQTPRTPASTVGEASVPLARRLAAAFHKGPSDDAQAERRAPAAGDLVTASWRARARAESALPRPSPEVAVAVTSIPTVLPVTPSRAETERPRGTEPERPRAPLPETASPEPQGPPSRHSPPDRASRPPTPWSPSSAWSSESDGGFRDSGRPTVEPPKGGGPAARPTPWGWRESAAHTASTRVTWVGSTQQQQQEEPSNAEAQTNVNAARASVPSSSAATGESVTMRAVAAIDEHEPGSSKEEVGRQVAAAAASKKLGEAPCTASGRGARGPPSERPAAVSSGGRGRPALQAESASVAVRPSALPRAPGGEGSSVGAESTGRSAPVVAERTRSSSAAGTHSPSSSPSHGSTEAPPGDAFATSATDSLSEPLDRTASHRYSMERWLHITAEEPSPAEHTRSEFRAVNDSVSAESGSPDGVGVTSGAPSRTSCPNSTKSLGRIFDPEPSTSQAPAMAAGSELNAGEPRPIEEAAAAAVARGAEASRQGEARNPARSPACRLSPRSRGPPSPASARPALATTTAPNAAAASAGGRAPTVEWRPGFVTSEVTMGSEADSPDEERTTLPTAARWPRVTRGSPRAALSAARAAEEIAMGSAVASAVPAGQWNQAVPPTSAAVAAPAVTTAAPFVATEAPATEAVATEAVATEAAETEAVATEAVATEAVATEAVATEAPATEAVETEAVATEAAATEAAETEAVATEAVATEAVATEAVATEVPATEAVETEAVATEAVATEAVATEAVATEAPATEAVATEAAETEAVATEAVTTEAAETEAVATDKVATEAAETEAVSTEAVATEAAETQAVATEAAATEAVATETAAVETEAAAVATETAAVETEAPAGTTEAVATEAVATEAVATEAAAGTTEAVATEAAATEAGTTEAPEAVATEAVATEAVTTEAPATEAVATETAAVETEAAVTEAPAVATETVATEEAATEAPAGTTEAVATEAAATEAIATEAVATEAVATEAPAGTTKAVATEAAATEAVATEAAATEAVATEAAETEAPAGTTEAVAAAATEAAAAATEAVATEAPAVATEAGTTEAPAATEAVATEAVAAAATEAAATEAGTTKAPAVATEAGTTETVATEAAATEAGTTEAAAATEATEHSTRASPTRTARPRPPRPRWARVTTTTVTTTTTVGARLAPSMFPGRGEPKGSPRHGVTTSAAGPGRHATTGGPREATATATTSGETATAPRGHGRREPNPAVVVAEDRPPVFKGGTRIHVSLSLRIDLVFSVALLDPASPQRRALVENFHETIDPFFWKVSGFQDLIIKRIRNGSTIVDTAAVFLAAPIRHHLWDLAEVVRASGLQAALAAGVFVGGARVVEVVLDERRSALCGRAFVCAAGFACAEPTRRGRAPVCSSRCHAGFCLNDGVCSHRPPEGPACRCPVGEDFWFVGPHCDEKVTAESQGLGRVAGVALGVAMALAAAVTTLAVLVARRRRGRRQCQHVTPAVKDTEQEHSSYRRFSRCDEIWSRPARSSWTWGSARSLASEEAAAAAAVPAGPTARGPNAAPVGHPRGGLGRDGRAGISLQSGLNVLDSGLASDTSASSLDRGGPAVVHRPSRSPGPRRQPAHISPRLLNRRPYSYCEGLELVEMDWLCNADTNCQR
ncbi:uncharacterized protein LOC116946069 isoform X2 [Petromyzon marinus]|uniref:uncharacterized protein LOC116946069 isoform X2 n=1 Tax=Petromyzon marinus TaxID=7757 RepID=UPI003F710E57